jgi:glycosyltransferase involved in cell wall biosynthesis
MTLAHDGSAAPIERAPGFPSTLLALVDRDAPDDGVSYVGSLLERALSELAPRTRTITVFPDVEGGADASLAQRTMFTVKLLTAGRALDCVLYNHLGVATAHTTLPARLRRPYAVFIHGAEAWGTDLEPERTRALRDAVVRIANSAHTARRVHEVHPDSAPAEVCPLALLPDRDTSPVDGALVSSITERTIVIAGRMNARERYKGHDELLEAWPTVLRRRTDARLVIIGRGDDVKRLQAKANGLGLAGSVRFTGLVSTRCSRGRAPSHCRAGRRGSDSPIFARCAPGSRALPAPTMQRAKWCRMASLECSCSPRSAKRSRRR